MEWARMLAHITGAVDEVLLLRNEYLSIKYRILRAQIKGRVHGELIVKPQREADRALGSEPAHGSHSTWFVILECPQQIQPAYRRRVSYGRDDGCNTFGNLQVFSPSQPRSRIMYG